jgi:hypothetical protein
LSGEASAYYHSYVLAQMGVAQTREHFLSRDGHLVDNPAIGPDLRRCYWQPGNSKRFSELIAELTGKPASAEALARAAAMTGDEVVAEALERIARLDTIPSVVGELELDGQITIVHGNETVATTASSSFAGLCDQFATWIDAQVESAR